MLGYEFESNTHFSHMDFSILLNSIFELVNVQTSYEWSKIRGIVQ